MALQWKWNEKCGEAVLRQTIDGETMDFTLNLYTGNAFLIMIREFKENGENMYSLHSFWVDKKHMENCLGITKGHHNIYSGYETFTKFCLNMEKCRYWKEIAEALKKAFPGMVIELY